MKKSMNPGDILINVNLKRGIALSEEQATKEVKAVLRRFSRAELEVTAAEYIKYEAMRGNVCKITPSDIETMTDNQIRKFIYERDFPGEKWIR